MDSDSDVLDSSQPEYPKLIRKNFKPTISSDSDSDGFVAPSQKNNSSFNRSYGSDSPSDDEAVSDDGANLDNNEDSDEDSDGDKPNPCSSIVILPSEEEYEESCEEEEDYDEGMVTANSDFESPIDQTGQIRSDAKPSRRSRKSTAPFTPKHVKDLASSTPENGAAVSLNGSLFEGLSTENNTLSSSYAVQGAPVSSHKTIRCLNLLHEVSTKDISPVHEKSEQDNLHEASDHSLEQDTIDANPLNSDGEISAVLEKDIIDSEYQEAATLPMESSPSPSEVEIEDQSILEISQKSGQSEAPLVDLTQSDDESDVSLTNSPVGASVVRLVEEPTPSVDKIVAELSEVTHRIQKNQELLETLVLKNLPDDGRNLRGLVLNLEKKKAELEQTLQRSKHIEQQKAAFNEFRAPERRIIQSTLHQFNIQPSAKIKSERDEFSSGKADHSESVMPSWGDLPKPDMSVSGFGKQAMQTHLTEKALTMEALSKLHNALKTCPDEDTFEDDPVGLRVELMPHQKHALAWLLWREKERPAGGILADDMGLGKTLTMISLILKSAELMGDEDEGSRGESSDEELESKKWKSTKRARLPKGGTLVVCPASLMSQWEGEVKKRTKKKLLCVELYHGNNRERKPRRLAKFDIVITTYNLLSRESGVETAKNAATVKEKGPLFLIKWERVILDEAHMVRNHKSQMALGVCELLSRYRWCLTGTPIQNKELDLFALLKFLKCTPFDDLVVWKRWVDNRNAAGMQRLNTMMKSLMLRRTKEQLQSRGELGGLPEKNYETIDVNLDPEELEVYEKLAVFSKTLFAQFLHQRSEKQQALDARYGFSSQPTWQQNDRPDNQFTTTDELAEMHRRMQGLPDVKSHEILVLILRLRQICCHPGLVKKMIEKGDLAEDLGDETAVGVNDESGLDVDLFNQMNNLNINSEDDMEATTIEQERKKRQEILSLDNPVFSFERPSAKIRSILELLEEKILGTEDKVVIVSQWTSVLHLLHTFVKEKSVRCEMLCGDVPVSKRQDIVQQFNKPFGGPQVLLLSLTAGGVGLNLVGGNHLILMDIHWNPQLEAQACDRIYRVGQKKSVFVYRFLTVGTIEERIKALQDKKLKLAEDVLTGTRNMQGSKLTLDDLKLLFSFTAPAPAVDAAGAALPT